MSQSTTRTKRQSVSATLPSPRELALLGIAIMTAGYLSTLYWVTTVVGGEAWLAGSVGVGLGAGILFRNLEEGTVARIATLAAIAAGAWYHLTAVSRIDADVVFQIMADTLVMLTGISVLDLAAVDVWIAALVPVPVFLTTYFALRGRYGLAAAAGTWLVIFLALTGDATLVETLVGMVGAVLAVGFGELDRRDGSVSGADVLVALLAVMAVLALVVPLVPSGSAQPLTPKGVDVPGAAGQGGSTSATPLDEALLEGDSVSAGGPINLSPDVRFVVKSEDGLRWRVGTLGSYTGDGWTRVGQSRQFLNARMGPPGQYHEVTQTYDLRTAADDLPAAAYPVGVSDNIEDQVLVTSTGSLTVDGQLEEGTTYRIQSEVPDPDASTIRNAGRDYPRAIERRYTSLPESTPDRVANLTDQVTSQAETPYEEAVAIESYLEATKEYSQHVSAPDGPMADSFLFEMDAGYCVYYAGTMAAMLRTQDVPARVAVGYNSGQYVGNDTWVVRGTDAHAWVEVYIEDVGWVEFDPTPATPRRDAERSAIEAARQNGTDLRVDVEESAGQELEFEKPPEPSSSSGEDSDTNGTTTNDSESIGGNGTTNQGVPPAARSGATYSGIGYAREGNGSSVEYVEPDLETLVGNESTTDNGSATNGSATGPAAFRDGDRLLGGFDGVVLALLLIAGTVAGGRRVGLHRRLRYAGDVLWQPRTDPATDAERAMRRLERVLERRYDQPRGDGETFREYRRRLPVSVDDRVHDAFELYEQIRYAGEADPERVAALVELVDEVARDPIPVLGR